MALKKNSRKSGKYTQLLLVFKAHFSSQLNLASTRLIYLFISALCKIKSVNFVKLSARVNTFVDASSRYRRIQQFIPLADLAIILVDKPIFSPLPEKDNLDLSMDRTNWKFGDKTSIYVCLE